MRILVMVVALELNRVRDICVTQNFQVSLLRNKIVAQWRSGASSTKRCYILINHNTHLL